MSKFRTPFFSGQSLLLSTTILNDKMKIWREIYFGGLANYITPPN